MSRRDSKELNQSIYLDNHATTPVDPRVVSVMVHTLSEEFGNASSADHEFGDSAARVVDSAREEVASLIGATSDDVIFTSGATESANLAILGFASWFVRVKGRQPRVAVSAVEHRAVIETARALANQRRIVLSELPVDSQARLDIDALRSLAKGGLDLVAVMGANNEVGTIYRLDQIGLIASESGATFFTDATQAVGKTPVSMASSRISMLGFTAHKLYGPKGIGVLAMSPGVRIDPVFHGGGHQHGLRPGTLNVAGIAGLGEACRLRRAEFVVDEGRISALRDHLQGLLLEAIPGLVINGPVTERLAGNLHVSVPDAPNGAVISRIRSTVALATGSACSSGIESPSHVLRAMGLSQAVQEGALRFGVGKFTTMQEIETAASIVSDAVRDCRHALGNWPPRTADRVSVA